MCIGFKEGGHVCIGFKEGGHVCIGFKEGDHRKCTPLNIWTFLFPAPKGSLS